MKESSKELLLAEHERCRELEKVGIEGYERGLQFYIAVITLAIGAFVFLLEDKVPSVPFVESSVLLFVFVLFVGEVTFLRLIGLDIWMMENAQRYALIRERFVAEDPELTKSFLAGIVANERRFAKWASFVGIIRRVFSTTQQKTMVVLLNCVTAGCIAFALSLPTVLWSYLLVASAVFATALLHAMYASWRYRVISKALSSKETRFWI